MTTRVNELNGPYFHTGGYLTLRQVVDFYDRGGDFPNITDEQAATIRTMMRQTSGTIKELIETER